MVLEMPDSNYKNLASAVLENAGTTSDTSITIASTYAANFPDAPFFATIMPTTDLPSGSNSEIVKVTASSTSGSNTTFTITRAQRGTSAISWSAGQAILSHSVYVEDVEAQGEGIFTAVLTNSATNEYTITNASAPTTPSLGDRMRVMFDTDTPAASYTTGIIVNGAARKKVVPDPIPYNQKLQAGNAYTSIWTVYAGVVYDLVYQNTVNGGVWVAQNAHDLVQSDDIASEAVTKGKINWGNLGSKGTDLSGTVAAGDYFGYVKTGTYNGAGTYVIIATATLIYSGSSAALPGIEIFVGTNMVADGTCQVSGGSRINVSASYTGSVPANTYIYVRAAGATLQCLSGNLSIIRIGS